MNIEPTVELTEELIRFESTQGKENEALDYLRDLFTKKGWDFEELPGGRVLNPDPFERSSIFVPFCENPLVVFSTHIDVVPGSPDQFRPVRRDGDLHGRGACDAKGILACMITACEQLCRKKERDFALLVVHDEEANSAGAKQAVECLNGLHFRYLVNGEPTRNKIATGHKGVVQFEVAFQGKPAHSGHPEEGIDANKRLLEIGQALYAQDYGYDERFGHASINLGVIQGGDAHNIISPDAMLKGLVRVVGDPEIVKQTIEKVIGKDGFVDFKDISKPVELKSVPGFSRYVAPFYSDIPHLMPLFDECLMYGPGDIMRAHTSNEWIAFHEMEKAVLDYRKIYNYLKSHQ